MLLTVMLKFDALRLFVVINSVAIEMVPVAGSWEYVCLNVT